jgi:CubicO group peptidase (beta-lactamase class C family)
MSRRISRALLGATLAFLGPAWGSFPRKPWPSAPRPPPRRFTPATPESVGMSTARLALLTDACQKEIAEKRLPGVVMMVSRRGRPVYSTALGLRDPRGAEPRQSNSLFRIYSMTKPIVSGGGMLLVADGTLLLTDRVSKWLPAFKDVTVWTANGEVSAERPMTVRDLLRHTAG